MPRCTSTRRTTRRGRIALRERMMARRVEEEEETRRRAARVLQRAVRRSGLLDGGFVVL